jgi:hypothetical protein
MLLGFEWIPASIVYGRLDDRSTFRNGPPVLRTRHASNFQLCFSLPMLILNSLAALFLIFLILLNVRFRLTYTRGLRPVRTGWPQLGIRVFSLLETLPLVRQIATREAGSKMLGRSRREVPLWCSRGMAVKASPTGTRGFRKHFHVVSRAKGPKGQSSFGSTLAALFPQFLFFWMCVFALVRVMAPSRGVPSGAVYDRKALRKAHVYCGRAAYRVSSFVFH